MRGIALSFVLGTVLAAGTLPAVAQPVQAAAPVTAKTGTETPYRQTYEEDARTRLRVWGQEVTAFNKKTEAKGRSQDNEAGSELNIAWTETKAEERKMEVAGADDWESVRTSFDHASHRFEDALGRARSDID
jgi:hypothetical protein